jgi:hypothetical protein
MRWSSVAAFISSWFVVGLAAGAPDAPPPPKERVTKPAANASLGLRYLDEKVNGLKVAETPHFRILHDQDKDVVAKVAKIAEDARVALQKRWFGDVSIEWDGKCSIYLHGTLKDYSKKTGLKNTLGHMRTLDLGIGIRRSIHVPCKEPRLATEILPHEVCHSVMAVRFQGQTPRWADEGMAMLAQTPDSVQECVGLLPGIRKNDNLFSLEVLMQTHEAEHMNTMEYYAQATSLVQFLCQLKGEQEFPKFLRTSLSKGYEPALKQHFGIESFRDLDERWQSFAFGKAKSSKK